MTLAFQKRTVADGGPLRMDVPERKLGSIVNGMGYFTYLKMVCILGF